MKREFTKEKIEKILKGKQKEKGQKASARWPLGVKVYEVKNEPNSYCLELDEKATLKNMQDDSVAFEGWALVLKSWLGAERITLSWSSELIHNENLHYQRFLYRVIRFKGSMYKWFDVENLSLLEDSRVLHPDGRFREGKFLLNYETETRKGGEGKNEDSEDAWEKRFYDCPESLLKISKAQKGSLNRQLPVGLFKDKVRKNTKNHKPQIFPGGKAAIDLWALADDGKLIIYELKKPKKNGKSNKKIGAISELLFYSYLMQDFQNQNNLNFNCSGKSSSADGKDGTAELVEKSKGVIGYILMDEIHPLLHRKELFLELNSGCSNEDISIGFLEYEKVNDCRLVYP